MAAQDDRRRLFDLLADRALGEALSADEARDLESLLARHPDVDPHSFDVAAAAIHLALIRPLLSVLPEHLGRALLSRAEGYLGGSDRGPRPLDDRRPRSQNNPSPRPLSNPWLGWIVAAAAALVLVLRAPQGQAPAAPTPTEVASASDALRVAWSATEDPDASGVSGDVVWSDELQTGYMRFEGLPVNDPRVAQYQLWIFDPERPAEYPVDGGVFDMLGDELTVPIDAKIAVAKPTLFAITLERPGGVVVSTRERLLLTASPQS